MDRKIGKFLAYILRHNPSAIGLTLDAHGWADVRELSDGARRFGYAIDADILREIVAQDEKCRFSWNADQTKIRANQGHSIDVDVQMPVCAPPDVLYHGTAEKYADSIKKRGIEKRSRRFVHLSADRETALKVGARHGKAVVFVVDAKTMAADGYTFLLSANGVWQTEYVPSEYIAAMEDPPVL